MQQTKQPKKKSNWMTGFVFTPKHSDIENVEIARRYRCTAYRNKSAKR